MGLFGGFKAKFTRNSTPKVKQQEVVCLRYHIHSEFDAQEPSKPVQTNSLRRNEAPPKPAKRKDRKAVTKSVVYPENETSDTSLSSSKQQKSISLTNLSTATPAHQVNGHADVEPSRPLTFSTTFNLRGDETSTAISDVKFGKSTEDRNGIVTEKAAIVADNHLYTPDRTDHSQTIFSKVTTYNKDQEVSYQEPDRDHSTLIFMTQHSSRSSSFDRNMNGDDLKFVSNKMRHGFDDDDEADYFKVNVVKHDPNRSYSFSEEEKSDHEESGNFNRMGFSSQAASIFFGEGEEEEVARPRRIQLVDEDDEDERRSSGADC